MVAFNLSVYNSGTISANIGIPCGTVTSTTIVSKLGINALITGTKDLCGLSTATYSVPSTLSSNFNWSVPSYMTIVSGQNTSSITVALTGGVANAAVSVSFISNCGLSESLSFNVGCSKVTQIQTSQCGVTIAALNTTISANSVGGASGYRFEVSDGTNTSIYDSSTNSFNLTMLTGSLTIGYGKVYTIRVALKYNGVAQPYGTPCTVTTPAAALAGTISGGGNTVCSGSSSTTLTVSGYSGTLLWQKSTAASPTWVNAGSTSNTLTVSNIIVTTYYRVVATNAGSSANSSTATIFVTPISVGGVVSGAGNVCYGSDKLLTLSGNTGTIQWQQSSSSTTGYTDIVGATSATYNATNITSTKYFRAVVTNGVCSAMNSASATITVTALPVSGTITGGGVVS